MNMCSSVLLPAVERWNNGKGQLLHLAGPYPECRERNNAAWRYIRVVELL
jgi:hypothetical protein